MAMSVSAATAMASCPAPLGSSGASSPSARAETANCAIKAGQPRVVGSVVFHGRPPHGIAEVAYAVEESSRCQGYACEATGACVDWALTQAGIVAVQATTFPWHLASLGVIRRIGMTQVATREHESLGELLVFERRMGTV